MLPVYLFRYETCSGRELFPRRPQDLHCRALSDRLRSDSRYHAAARIEKKKILDEFMKNDQTWIEQKNGSLVRRMVGYGRLPGVAASTALGKLHDVVRLYVNFFSPLSS
jgi:hypothetical protein